MNRLVESLLGRYNIQNANDLESALKEIIQEMTLSGLARSHFFDKAAFYGGTALRIFHGLPRFSEDLYFTLLNVNTDFKLKTYFNAIEEQLFAFGFEVEIESSIKKHQSDIDSAFLKANTQLHFFKINSGQYFADKIQSNKKMTIKFEVDTTPPLGFQTEIKNLLPPVTAEVRLLKPSSLFAGKIHAVLFRKWKNRIKGRDFYDLLWFIGQNIPVDLTYLESKMRQGSQWEEQKKLSRADLIILLKERIQSIDFKNAAMDVNPFLKTVFETEIWSKDLFLKVIEKVKVET